MVKRTPIIVWLPPLVFIAALAWFSWAAWFKPTTMQAIQALIPGTTVSEVRPTPLDGVYEVIAGPNIFYMQPGKPYLLVGHLFDLSNSEDLTQLKKDQLAHSVAPQEQTP
ncbi:disulfide isomerase DsbC N-terminal domain-containing protein [Thiothrix sp.]|jgi:hypothetical protein|uniref:disulfide isomerase DsbC N-terminal domain-containing protein n=1 Tax=Thiothrix sp. TaxID=1032 RepID=UPI00257D24C5|nr:disulfide isomerase DsbC N-terminal domain-containing protein [Thiothrix sp.]